jgi:hypothetical protein
MDTSHLFGEWSEVYSDGITEKRHHDLSIPRWYNHLCTTVGCKRNKAYFIKSYMTLILKFVKTLLLCYIQEARNHGILLNA